MIQHLIEALRLPPQCVSPGSVFNAPHFVALVKMAVRFPDGEAEMFQSESALADLFAHAPSVFAAGEMAIYSI